MTQPERQPPFTDLTLPPNIILADFAVAVAPYTAPLVTMPIYRRPPSKQHQVERGLKVMKGAQAKVVGYDNLP